jgi:hypothetical protein
MVNENKETHEALNIIRKFCEALQVTPHGEILVKERNTERVYNNVVTVTNAAQAVEFDEPCDSIFIQNLSRESTDILYYNTEVSVSTTNSPYIAGTERTTIPMRTKVLNLVSNNESGVRVLVWAFR